MSRLIAILIASLAVCVSIATGDDRYPSPTIESLRVEIGKRNDATAFWRRLKNDGAPIVEPFGSDGRYVLVTFVWHGTSATRNVAVVSTVTKTPIEAMTRLGRSDVWYATAKVPTGARFAYWLAVNSPMVLEGPRVREQLATLQADPLNPHRWLCGPDADLFHCQSKLELPDAVPQPWIVPNPDTPKGTIEVNTVQSNLLMNQRDVSVYLPPGYRRDAKPYALLVVFDGNAYLSTVPTPVILDNLIAASRIQTTVAVFVGNPSPETRNTELAPNAVFADFLATELIPWARSRYNVTTEPGRTVVAGSSFGGLAAVYAGLRHPEVFGNVLCQSGDFSWAPEHLHQMGQLADATTETGWLAKEFIKSPRLPLRFYMDAGVFEVDQFGTGGMMLETSRHMRDVLLAKGYEVHYQQFVGGHDYLSWRGTFADGLTSLIGESPH